MGVNHKVTSIWLWYYFQLEGPVRTVIAGLNDASENLRKLSVLTDCHNLHKDYTDGIEAICYSAL